MGQKWSVTFGLRVSHKAMKTARETFFNRVGLEENAMQRLHTSVKKVKYEQSIYILWLFCLHA